MLAVWVTDPVNSLDRRIAARQSRYSLIHYAASSQLLRMIP